MFLKKKVKAIEEHTESEKTDEIPLSLPEEKEDNELLDKVFQDVIEYFINKETLLMGRLLEDEEKMESVINEINKKAIEQFSSRLRSSESKVVPQMMERFKHYMWGFHVLEELVNDTEVSDIKVYNAKNIRVKKNGVRSGANVTFNNDKEFERFVRMICTRNKKNLSIINAQLKFMDTTSNPNFRLRFNITSRLINQSGLPSLHIRKIPKFKYSMDDLQAKGYFNKAQKEYLIKRFQNGDGIFFVGSNGSGKTYGINALLDWFPQNKSALCMQETDELFAYHPDINFQHTIEPEGEGRVSYGLKELANIGLMDDIDCFILGEVKSGIDAASLPMVAATGSQIILSGHGHDEYEGLYKLGDYMKQVTGYGIEECMRYLIGIRTVVHVHKFRVDGMAMVDGWNYETGKLNIIRLNENCEPILNNKVASFDTIKRVRPDYKDKETSRNEIEEYIIG